MKLLVRILIVTLAVTLTLLIKESEARNNKRWIQGTGFGGRDAEDLEDEEVSELSRRDAQESQSQQTQQEQSGQDKDKLEFPAFPTGYVDEGDQQQPTVASEFDQQEPSSNDDQQVPTANQDHLYKDRLEQETETLDQNQDEYGSKGSIRPKEPIKEPSVVEEEQDYKPWYKKVGHFFKKHYSNIKDSLRGRRNDYYYSE